LKLQRNTNPAVAKRETHADILFRNLKGRVDVEDPGLDRRIMNIIEMERELVDWIQLAQDRHKWRVVMNTVVDPRVV
jgi:hypothetical protein